MIEEYGNIWDIEADVKCITTNGVVKKNGEAVMGAGVAKQAKLLYPELPKVLGDILNVVGNHVAPIYRTPEYWLFTFPVKNDWKEKAKYTLINRSAKELRIMIDDIDMLRSSKGIDPIERIVLPRPGCGNGQLPWPDVRSIIEPYFDDRFIIVELNKS